MPKLNQKGFAHILLIFILLTGIIAGVYLVQHPTIFKSKADEPSTGPEYNQWLTNMHQLGIYPAYEDGEVVLYNKEKFTQKYCSAPNSCYLEDESYAEVLTRAQKSKDIIGLLANKLYQQGYAPYETLKDYFPELTRVDLGGIYPDSSQQNLITEIDESTLSNYIREIEFELNPVNKSIFDAYIDTFDPIFGTRIMVNMLSKPPQRWSPEEVKYLIDSLTLMYGPAIVWRELELSTNTTFNMAKMIADVRPIRKAIESGERVPLKSIVATSRYWIKEDVVKALRGLPIKNVAGMTNNEQYMLLEIRPLLDAGKAYVLDPKTSRPYLEDLITQVERIYKPIGLPKLNKKAIMKTIDNNWVVMVDDDEFVRLYGINTGALTTDRFVIIRQSQINNPHTFYHEFIHVISSNNRQIGPILTRSIGGTNFRYSQEQDHVYGMIMSRLYELFTDEIVSVIYGEGEYKNVYPRLYYSLNKFAEDLIRATGRRFTYADFTLFALTGNDDVLMNKLLSFGVTQDEFIRILGKDIDVVKLNKITTGFQTRYKSLPIYSEASADKAVGVLFLSDYFSKRVAGKDLPNNIYVVYEPFDQDIDLTPSQSSQNYLNCSYSQQDFGCFSGTTVCTGHTDNNRCSGKTPEECLNLVQCQYDSSQGSSCRCSQ